MAPAAPAAPIDSSSRPQAPAVPFAAVVLLIFASTALRIPGTFLYPSFWAEDLTIFFKDSIEIGPAALGQHIFGSYHTIPRLIALAASLGPVAWAPALFALGAGLMSSLCLALFSRQGFRWLVPDDRVRLFACWLFSFLPGTNESFFALCGVNYAVFVGVLFLILERDASGRWRMGHGRALLVSFLWFSLGQGIVLALPLAFLFWLTRNRAYLLCLGALGVSVLLNLAARNTYVPTERPGLETLAFVYVDNVFLRLVFIPLAGRWIEYGRAMPAAPFYLVSTALLAGYIYAVVRKRALDAEGGRVLAVAIIATMAHFPLTALARSYGAAMFFRPYAYLGGRHALMPSILVLLLLGLWLARPARSRWARAFSLALLLWATSNILSEPLYEHAWPFRPFVWEWPRQAATIDKALADRRAGRLTAPVVLKDIHCRPDEPYWRIPALVIRP
jgi:hypothetical protein